MSVVEPGQIRGQKLDFECIWTRFEAIESKYQDFGKNFHVFHSFYGICLQHRPCVGFLVRVSYSDEEIAVIRWENMKNLTEIGSQNRKSKGITHQILQKSIHFESLDGDRAGGKGEERLRGEVRSIVMKIRRYRFPYGPLQVIVRRRLLRLKMRLGNVASLVKIWILTDLKDRN